MKVNIRQRFLSAVPAVGKIHLVEINAAVANLGDRAFRVLQVRRFGQNLGDAADTG